MNSVADLLAQHRRVGRFGCRCGYYFTHRPVLDDEGILAEHDAHVADILGILIAAAWDEGAARFAGDDAGSWYKANPHRQLHA